MKKLLAILFTAALLLSFAFSASAANGSFVSSPSNNQAPVLVSGKHTDADCKAEIEITAYADRALLGAAEKANLEAAYASIASAEDLGALSESIDKLADKLNVDSETLMVCDLFDVSYDCDPHEQHDGEFKITIKPTVTENFAALIHYSGEKWEIVNSKLADGEISFSVEDLSPFAIVVHDGTASEDESYVWLIILIIVLVIAAGVAGYAIYRYVKNKKANNVADQTKASASAKNKKPGGKKKK